MSEHKNSDHQHANTPSGTNLTRRKITKAALASPIVASISVTPAFGCSVSGFLSGNTSNPHEYECGGSGCTPGFWKNNLSAWSVAGFDPGQCKPLGNDTTPNHCKEWDADSGTKIGEILPASCPDGALISVTDFGETGLNGEVYTNSTSIMFILLRSIKGRGNANSLLAHYIAAIFNASANPAIYGSSRSDIEKGLCLASSTGRMIEYKDILGFLNQRGCFLDAHGNCEDNFVHPNPDVDTCVPACPKGEYYDYINKVCTTTPQCPEGEHFDTFEQQCKPK